jgi:hypothetical protein
LIDSLVFRFLVADIFLDHLLVFANGRYKVTASPKLLASEVLFLTGIGSGNVNCTLAFHITDHLGNTVFWRYAYQHMHVIRHQAASLNMRLLVPSQLGE